MPTVDLAPALDGHINSQDVVYGTARTGSNLTVSTTSVTGSPGQNLVATVNHINEIFFSFDTSSIPDDATVTSAELHLFGSADNSTQDFVLEVRVRDWGDTLTTADWVSGASLGSLGLIGSLDSSLWVVSAYNVIAISNPDDQVQKTGFTRFLLCSSRHRVGSAPLGAEFVNHRLQDQAGTSEDPFLRVVYTEASTSGNNGSMMRGVG